MGIAFFSGSLFPSGFAKQTQLCLHNILENFESFLLKMYSECGDLHSATNIFDKLNQQNVFSWNVIIGAYGKSGMLTEAADLLRWMPTHNVVSWNTLFSAYVHYGCGMRSHGMLSLWHMLRMGMERRLFSFLIKCDGKV